MKRMKALLVLIILGVGTAWAAGPHIGYLYPAGGQTGTTVRITAGGQGLRGAKDVYVSGEGITAGMVEYQGQVKKLNQDQKRMLGQEVRYLRQKKMAALYGRKPPKRPQPKPDEEAADSKPVELPDHPLLDNLDKLTIEGLDHVIDEFVRPSVLQINPQIAETVVLELVIDPNAAPGPREIRLVTNAGLSNPLVFEIGTLPEVCEPELSDPGKIVTTNVELPVLINGQILPGEIDRFRFTAEKGQNLVIETQARKLIPYLGDAVPGWFQATVRLLDGQGRETAFADDWRFDPDPVLCYEIPKSGDYVLEINDAIYRGREDFVYRVSIAEKPFVTSIFPLGTPRGKTTKAAVSGWNLDGSEIVLDGRLKAAGIRQAVLTQNGLASNPAAYAVDAWEECGESEANDTPQQAQPIDLPRIVNGRIEKAGDRDCFRFEGKAGQSVVAEVAARRLHSPLDSLLYLTDAEGAVIEWNDDSADRNTGLETHHADSRLSVTLPRDGTYCVQVSDTRSHGGEAYGYRLHVGPPRPDFELYVTPSSLNLSTGRTEAVTVHAIRKDGFDGEIEIAFKDAPKGFQLGGGRIPPGVDTIRMTVTAPQQPINQPTALHLQGTGRIDGKAVTRPVTAAEDMMQAFIYRHLVGMQELAVFAPRNRQFIPFDEKPAAPIQIPAGGTARVQIRIPNRPAYENLQLELNEPPAGLRLEDVIVRGGRLAFTVTADGKEAPAGLTDNLIVDAYAMVPQKNKEGQPTGKTNKVSYGVLPAIPFEITNAQAKP